MFALRYETLFLNSIQVSLLRHLIISKDIQNFYFYVCLQGEEVNMNLRSLKRLGQMLVVGSVYSSNATLFQLFKWEDILKTLVKQGCMNFLIGKMEGKNQ